MTAEGPLLALFGDGPGVGGGIARYNTEWLQAQAPRPVHAVFRQAINPQALLHGGDHAIAGGRLGFIRAALRLAARVKPAVVYCAHLHYAPLAAWLCRRHRARLWLQLHGVEAWPLPGRLRRQAAESAALVTCVSRYTRSRFLSWARIAPERVRVLPNTVGPEFVPAPRDQALAARLQLTGGPRLLTVGRLSASERYKGHDHVIRCLPRLRDAYPDLEYLIAGDGDDRPRLQALAADLGVTAQVRFLGQVSHQDLPSLYRLADLYVMPSSGEGFGIVYLESMCCGTPALGLAGDGSADPLADGVLGNLAATTAELPQALAHALQTRRQRDTLALRARARFAASRFAGHLHACSAEAGKHPAAASP